VTGVIATTDVLVALSVATDLGTAMPLEHAARTGALARWIAEEAGLGDDVADAAAQLGLLHALGCTSDATETAAQLGEDRAARAAWTLVDPARPPEVVRFLWASAGVERAGAARVGTFARALAAGRAAAATRFATHCEVAERLAERLGAPPAVREGLTHVFERWDGKGLPAGVAGEAIPAPARVLQVARDAVARHGAGQDAAAIVTAGAGRAYDPALARRAAPALPRLLQRLDGANALAEALGGLPAEPLDDAGADAACAVIADFADLKSAWTIGHSPAVAELAEAAAWRAGLDAAAVRRAALVHDLGRVAVSTAVWDRPGPLGAAAWEQVRAHPLWTERALARGGDGLAALGAVAARHHERLDGSGYHRGCGAADLDAPARLLAAADVLVALGERRPHRPAQPPEAAAVALAAQARAGTLCPDAVRAVLDAAGARDVAVDRPLPGGLTAREAEVLVALARGASNKQAAAALGIAPKTVGRHAEAIYAKLGVRSRAAAALWAAEHGLLGARPGAGAGANAP
jgi:HD-GYP domain-containing protein (c-di-GMP phosphodiesterase class II)